MQLLLSYATRTSEQQIKPIQLVNGAEKSKGSHCAKNSFAQLPVRAKNT